MIDFREAGQKLWAALKHALTKNLGIKLFSAILAIALWSFVLTSDPNVTTERIMSAIVPSATNQSVLENRDLAVSQALSEVLPQVRVAIEVSRDDYYRISSNNVRVELDLSRIRETGEQTVPLTASTVYGTVTNISPDSVTLSVEELATRNVQVEIELEGEKGETGSADTGTWYSAPTANPSIITISGPRSQVEEVTGAYASIDLSTNPNSLTRAVGYSLIDADGKAVEYPTINTSTSSVIASVEAYPIVALPVENDAAKVLTGSPRTGFKIDSVEVAPSEIAVAGSRLFLDTLNEVMIYSINVTDMYQTTTIRTRINRQSEMKYVSAEEVLVTVHISEKTTRRTFDSMTPTVENLDPTLSAIIPSMSCSIKAMGLYTQLEQLSRNDITLFVDAYGLQPGEYDLPVQYTLASQSDVDIEIEPATLPVTIQ